MPLRPEVVRAKLLQISIFWQGKFQEAADEYREIPPRLVARGVLSAATAQRLENLAGFRNLLVYGYANIDAGRLAAGLDRLDDLEAFVADVEAWLTRSGR